MYVPEANILLDYIEKAMDMEASVYGQKLLALAYPRAVNDYKFNRPKEPKKNDRSDLTEPKKPDSRFDIIVFLFWMAFSVLSILAAVAMLISADFMMTIGSLLFCSLFLLLARKRLKKSMRRKAEYAEEIELYRNILRLDEELYNKKLEKYAEDIKRYDERVSAFREECKIMQEKLEKTLNETIEVREKFYAAGFVKEKYRNLAAVSSIYGYIEQKRTSHLEGMYGAYDIYDEELRQGIVIDRYPQDEEGLARLKKSQFDLYQIVRNKKSQTERLTMNLQGMENFIAFIDECRDMNQDIMALIEMGAWDEPDYVSQEYEEQDDLI